MNFKESLIIQNLGPIQDINLEEIKPFTILIGESGSGKSTLMKCLSLFRYLFKMENIKSYLKNSKITNTPFRIHIMKHFKESGLDEFITDKTIINYIIKYDDGSQIELQFEDKKYQTSSKISAKNLCFTKISFITENRNIIPLWANKGATLVGAFLGFYFHEVYKDFELASEHIKSLDLSHVGLKFIVKKSHKGKEYKIQDKNNTQFEIEFKNSSSGTQSSTPISIISSFFSKHFNFEEAFNRSTFKYLANMDSLNEFKFVKNIRDIEKKIYIHIEEPELSLFPDAQFELMENLVKDCFINNKYDTNLFISTHSPYIINHLNLMIKAYDKNANKLANYDYDKLAVYQLMNGKTQDLMIKNERLVNTNPLSDTINEIYDQYEQL